MHSPFTALRAAALAALAPLAGCATMFTGTTDPLRFDANVPGVRLTIDGQYKGELPLALQMSRNFMGGEQFMAKFEKDGFETQEFKLHREFNTVAILDVSSPVTCGGIDVLTGSLMRFSPLEYHVLMRPRSATAASDRDAAVRQFAAASFRRLQADLARRGGEHLAALEALAGGGDPDRARRAREAVLRDAPALLEAATPQAFVARLAATLEAGEPLAVAR